MLTSEGCKLVGFTSLLFFFFHGEVSKPLLINCYVKLNHFVLVIGSFSVLFMVKVSSDMIFVCSSWAVFFPHFFNEMKCSCRTIYIVVSQTKLSVMHLPSALLCSPGDSKADLRPPSPPALEKENTLCWCVLSKTNLGCDKFWGTGSQAASCLLQPLFPSRVKKSLEGRPGGSCLQPKHSEARAAGGLGVRLCGLSRDTVSKTKTTERI